MKCGECREVDVGTKGSAGGVSRRDFLKAAGLTATQMNLLWSSVLAQEGPAWGPAKTKDGRRARIFC